MTGTTEKFDDSLSASLVSANVQLKDIVKTLPRECFQKDAYKAWMSVLISLSAVTIGYVMLAHTPWFLLPIAWFFLGTALTGLFVIAHDCGHRSFAKKVWVNDWVGHILMLPLLYPFHSWRLLHDHHHLHTNKLTVDNAWHPWTTQVYAEASLVMKGLYRALRGWFWWTASVAHWGSMHFNPANVALRDRQKVSISIAAVVGFAALLFPILLASVGVWGVVKFWLMPWLGYHFWMSTFTLVHHTDADVKFHPVETWHAAAAQLAGTIHCRYPRWVEILCHDINVHIPHHISVAIPAYNLRLAHASLQQNWGSHLQEREFSLGLLASIVNHCHLYDADRAYLPLPQALISQASERK
jgi:omega-6 fatty acid desaturase (delta-12 desaturase)